MKMQAKQWIDWYLGGLLLFLIKPWVMLLGQILRRNHSLRVQGDIVFLKLLGGGSLVIAYPALLGLRRRYPQTRFRLVTTPPIRPFAEVLGIFDEILIVDDRNLWRLAVSSVATLKKLALSDTLIDLEVYSRLTTIFGCLTLARNRLGFYLQSIFWRKGLCTHLVFFNGYAPRHFFYEQMVRLLGAEPASPKEAQEELKKLVGAYVPQRSPQEKIIAVGACCSDLALERKLSVKEWAEVAAQRFSPKSPIQPHFLFLGGPRDFSFYEDLKQELQKKLPHARFDNFAGKTSLIESLKHLASAEVFWGIDTALLHYARYLGIPSTTWWGPTDPAILLQPIPGLQEELIYKKMPCSPCVHVAEHPPCQGKNVCIQGLFAESENDWVALKKNISW